MSRQKLYVIMNDDKGKRCTSGSRRGKVNGVDLDILTDGFNDGDCIIRLTNNEKIRVICNIPKNWELIINRIGEKNKLYME